MKDSWKEDKLGNLVLGRGEYGINAAACEYTPNLNTYLRITDISESGTFLFKGRKSVNHPDAEKFILKEGDITFARTGASTGKTYLYDKKDGKLVFAGFLIRFKPDPAKLDSTFLKFVTQTSSYKKWVSVYSARTGQPGINGNEYGEFKFIFPSLPHQKRIAKILTTCDEVIEQTEAAIAKYQVLKQGMMHDLFTRGIDLKTGEMRPKFEDAPELYKESELGMIPRDWEVNELSNLTKLITDGAHFSPTPQQKGLPIGNVKDMQESSFDLENCTKILPEVFNLLVRQNCSPQKNDVLLSKDGTIGKVIHFEDKREMVLLSSIAIIRVNELLSSRYLAWSLRSEYFDKALYALLSGSALKRITLRDIAKIRIPFSKNKLEQDQISNRFDAIQEKIQSEQSTLSKYQQLKSGLMQDLLTGNVEVKIAEEEMKT